MHRRSLFAFVAAALAGWSTAAPALTFDFTFLPGVTAEQQAAVVAAGNRWSALLSDPVTVKVTVVSVTTASSRLVAASPRRLSYTYTNVRTALAADATSTLDATAVANLAAGSSFGVLINRTSNSPNGAGSATPYVDNNGNANNTTIWMTAANARALGLAVSVGGIGSCTDCDAELRINNSGLFFDYNPADGIGAPFYDFNGFVMHELGHVLGFVSGVDILDQNSTGSFFADSLFTNVSPLDLFRWSALSKTSNVIDWTADMREKYFSIDRGTTVGPGFATGPVHGDGREAGAWKDGLGFGLMDSFILPGELFEPSSFDVKALDAIGWNSVVNGATRYFRAVGNVNGLTGNSALLPVVGNEGDRFVIDFAYDTAQPDVDFDASTGTYPIVSVTARVNGLSVPFASLGFGEGQIQIGDTAGGDSWELRACPQRNCVSALPLDEARLGFYSLPPSTLAGTALVSPPGGVPADNTNFLLFSLSDNGSDDAFLIADLESVTEVTLTDADSDGIDDLNDNCLSVANGPLLPDLGGVSQRDTDGDGYGNACDADFNNNGRVDSQDATLLRAAFGQTNAVRDLNGNGVVDSQDAARLRARFGQLPGPSGTRP